MLTVQPVRLSQQLPFRGVEAQENELKNYSKEQFQNDKSALEEQLSDLNSVIEDTNVPKPVRAFGKLISIGIGAALGFVSMKYGAQGMAKIVKKGAEAVGGAMKKPFAQSVGEKFTNGIKAVGAFFVKLYKKVAESRLGQAIGRFFSKVAKGIKESKFGQKVAEWSQNISNSDFGKNVAKKAAAAQQAVKEAAGKVTGEKIENGVVNLFAVSGGVSGGVSAIQDAAKD